jgi:glycosyltransferase involved in cell wall biosynthesis
MFRIINKQFTPNLKIEFKVTGDIHNHPVIFVWEDIKVSSNKKIDYIRISNNGTYFSSLDCTIQSFKSDIVFSIICADTYDVLFQENFINLSFIKGNNVLYLSQNTYTGYAYAARNYIYQLVQNGYNVQWDFIGDNNNYAFSRDEEFAIRKCCYNKLASIDSVIIHHTPEIFPNISHKHPKSHVYGLTTWETDTFPYEWINCCESVNTMIVPSEFNRLSLIDDLSIGKEVVVWNHTIFPFRKFKENIFENFCKKLTTLSELSISNLSDILLNHTIYYNISEFTPRKNIEQVIHCFCKKFKKTDEVCLLIKTNIQESDESDTFIKYKLKSILDKYNSDELPNIVFCFDKRLDESEIQLIHEIGDVYFTLNLGEGFGLSTFTAKKIGNRIICGKYGAESEFLDKNVDILLDYTLEHVKHRQVQSKLYLDCNIPIYNSDYVVDNLKYFEKTKKLTYNI